ncbi:MAG: serine/threonine-protein kinase [Myxococcales bacterium]|nr:serine/threonine-protein kinase [Myxococcales bacterium]
MGCLDDQQLAQLASGEGGSSDHLNTCASCTSRLDALRLAETLANPRSQLESAIGASARFGRYLVIERIGAGGMGEVFAAFDPTLDRKVALKLLRVDRDEAGSNGSARLQREAQAMAQVAHPNVAAVHDVGVHEGQVYVAMEFIDGQTLRDWCMEPGRTTQQVLDVYQQAGRGLAAAHRAGLIHRDFKPANVLVGTDGRPRVLDFGLARLSNVTPVSEATERSIGSVDLTAAGSVMGTPAYMPPEQHDGKPLDARADQYSFCVSLYEGLVGVLPFQGDSLKSIRAAIVGGLPAQAPRQIPARVFAALRRGLSVSPTDRFPSMEALLEALSNDAQLRRRRWLLMGGLGVSTLLAVGGLVSREVASRHCASAEPRLAGAWDSARREALTKSLASTAQGEAVVSRLDAYAQQWVGVSQNVCEAHRTRQQTPTAKYVLQTACLDRRLSDLRALASVLATADASILKGATVAVSGLRPLTTCLDASAEYADAEQERSDVEAKLSEARALARLGLAARAQTLATDVSSDPLASRRAQAEAWLVLGTVAHANTRFDEAERALNAAAAKGIAAGSFEVAAKAWSLMVDLYGRRLDKPKLAQERADLAEGALTRLGDDPEIAAYSLHAVGRFRLGESNFTAASQVFEKALAQAERAWGPDHPEVANVLDDLAWSNHWLGKNALARAMFERSLRIKAAVYAPDSVENAETLGRLAMVVAGAGDLTRAIELQERALSIRRGAATKPDFAVTTSLTNLTHLYLDAGRLDDALTTIDESLRILGRILEGDHLRVVGNLHSRGEVLLALGRLDDARRAFSDSLAMSERVKGPQHVLSADPLEGLAGVALKEQKPADAVPFLERALLLREHTPAHPLSYARTRFLLARALWDSGVDVARAKTLLVTARADFEAAGPAGTSHLRELDLWAETKKTH